MSNRWIATAAVLLVGTVSARGARGDDCDPPKVDPAAEKKFASLVQAIRKADADGVVALMASGKDARLTLKLTDVKPGAYPKDQAVEVLKTAYFKTREILSVTEDEGCTRGSETRLVRTYRTRVRSGGNETEGTLTAVLQKGDPGWSLDILSDH